jgi:ubiquinone/menaquinone biosynthesis C-methylase UbiE
MSPFGGGPIEHVLTSGAIAAAFDAARAAVWKGSAKEVLVSDEHRDFWSRVAPRYDAVVDLQIGPATRSLLRDRVAKEGRLGALVEFGCGTGFYTSVLAEKADAVTATDLSPGMLVLARDRTAAPNVTFRVEDCQKTSFPDAAFDTAFMSLVVHFTEPDATLAEMRRILRPGGKLIILNLDMPSLRGLDRIRSLARVVYRGATGYRMKPPKRFGANVMTEEQLRRALDRFGFEVVHVETVRDAARSSNIPVEYVRAVKR